ncbi:MAG: hypothetical protein R3C56_07350 [Pirellulaceae bacterium]
MAKRVSRLPPHAKLNIGVSGGLDSTLALLVAVKMCGQQSLPADRIAGITMPGFGTTSRTLGAARELMQHLGIISDEIDIRQLCLDMFAGLGHQPFGIDPNGLTIDAFTEAIHNVASDKRHDLVFENVQARVRRCCS